MAVILGIYNGFISAIAGLIKHFKTNFLYLLPFLLGIVVGAAAFVIPIDLAFEYIPLPAICLFVGLMLGGMPPILRDAGGKPKLTHVLALLLACGAAVAICFIPQVPNMEADGGLPVPSYFVLVGVGILASAGCIVPGISGSMIALIFGVYDLVIGSCSNLLKFTDVGQSLLVLLCFGVGVVIGFFSIALLMRFLLRRCPKGTYYAIIGFILGSVFSIFWQQQTKSGLINPGINLPLQIVLAVVCGAVGFAATYIFCKYFEHRKKEIKENRP